MAIVAAIGAELSSGQGVLQQWGDEPTGIALTFVLVIAGSLVTALTGDKDASFGPFTPAVEKLNGRTAMLGWAALLVIEALRGGVALF